MTDITLEQQIEYMEAEISGMIAKHTLCGLDLRYEIEIRQAILSTLREKQANERD